MIDAEEPGPGRPEVQILNVGLAAEVVEAEHGIWCPRCALPSASRIAYAVYSEATLLVVERSTLTTCNDCGEQLHHGFR